MLHVKEFGFQRQSQTLFSVVSIRFRSRLKVQTIRGRVNFAKRGLKMGCCTALQAAPAQLTAAF